MVDLKFMDFPGMWQHFSVPIAELDVETFEDGFGFDGSSIRGWQPIHASDMLVIPDPATAIMDPFTAVLYLVPAGIVEVILEVSCGLTGVVFGPEGLLIFGSTNI